MIRNTMEIKGKKDRQKEKTEESTKIKLRK